MDREEARQRLDRLRASRVKQPPDLSARREFDSVARMLRRLRKNTPAIAQAWQQQAPVHLRDRVRIVGVARGTLTLAVQDAATLHELSIVLRSGLESTLIAAAPTNVRRVRGVVDASRK